MGRGSGVTYKSYNQVVAEERRALDGRVEVDRVVAAWAAEQLGLSGADIPAYVDKIVAVGIRSPGGRGGFDRIMLDLASTEISVEDLRHRYFLAASKAFVTEVIGLPPSMVAHTD
jgi:hypothetical protein